MKLSPRLRALYNELIPGLAVADLCCDHGYLGVEAYVSGKFPEIIFIDQAPLAMKILEEKFNQYVYQSENPTRVKFITKDAAKTEDLLTGNVVIAGVGGMNMMQMLESLHQNNKLKPDHLILSPHRDEKLFEKPELFGLRHSHTNTVMESGYDRPIFVFKLPR